MKLSDLAKNLKEGKSITEIVDSDLNLIGNSDETDSLEDVKSNGTTDNFVQSTRQKGGLFRTTAISNMNYAGTIIEDEQVTNLNEYPIINKNLMVLIDSIKRSNPSPEIKAIILHIIQQSL